MNAPRVPRRGRALRLAGRVLWPTLVPLLSLVAIWPLLTQSLPSTDDGALHMLRLVQIDRALRHGVLPLRWAPDMAHGYGYPFFNFYASLSSYIAELWVLAGLTIPQAVAAATVCAYWVSGWGAYLLARDIAGNRGGEYCGGEYRGGDDRGGGIPMPPGSGHRDAPPTLVSRLAGLVAAVAYMYAPYQFIDSAYRGNLAETWALAILPWVLWTARLAVCLPRDAVSRERRAGFHTRRSRACARIVPLALCYAALIYTHNVYALISSPVLGLYLALLWWREGRTWKEAVRLSAAIGLGLALSAFFWLPAFGERGWTRFSTGLVDYRTFFLSLRELLALPPQLDLSCLNYYPPRSLSWGAILLAAVAVVLIAVRVFGTRRTTNDAGQTGGNPDRRPSPTRMWGVLCLLPWETLFFLAVFLVAAFLTVRASDWLWRTVPLLGFALIPWRFLGIASLGGSLVTGAVPALLADLSGADKASDRKPDKPTSVVTVVTTAAAAAAAIVLLIAAAVPWTYAEPFPQRDAYSVANILSWEYKSGLIGTTAKNEFLPAWSGGLPPEPADPRLTEEGDAIAARLDLTSLPAGARLVEADYRLMRAELVVESPEPFRALYKQFYFPGWRVTVDGQPVAQIATAPYGLLGFDVPAGRHTIVVRPTTTPLRLAGSMISGLALVASLTLIVAGARQASNVKRHRTPGAPSSVVGLSFAVLALLLLLVKEGWIDRTENVFRARRFDAEVTGGKLRGTRVDTAINFGNAYTLYGYDLPRQPTAAGEPLRVDLYLAARQPPGARPPGTDTVRAYVRLTDKHGGLWSLPDNTAPEGHRPPPDTAIWPTDGYGHWALQVHTLPGTPPGVYELRVGLFEPGTWAGLNVLGESGQMLSLSARYAPVEIARPRQPPRLEDLDLDETIDQAAAPGLRLLGVRIEHAPRRAGDPLTLALYWQAETRMDADYRLALAVRSGDRRLPLGEGLFLGRADHSTSSWVSGEVVRSLHSLRVPAAAEAGAYTVEAIVTDLDGQPVGPARTAAAGKLEPIERRWSVPEGMQPLEADLGGQVTLLGYTETTRGGEQRVILYWQAQREVHFGYKAFVQWIGAGQAVAQDDAIPGGWQRPTTGWLPGEVVADTHVLRLPDPWPPGEYTLIAGLYDEATLQRLPLFDASMRAIGDHVVLERRVVE